MALRVDHGDVDRWVVKLDEAAGVSSAEARKVVQKGALNIKKDAQQRARQIGRHVRGYPSAITYDTKETHTGAEAEIGPEVGRGQGSLGGILENGSPTSAPHPHMLPAGEAEAPRFERAMNDLAARLLEGQ